MALEKIYSIGQSQTRTLYGGHISCMIGTTYGKCVQNLPYIIPKLKQKFPPKPFGQIKQHFIESIFPHFIPIGKKTWSPWETSFLMSNHGGPSIDASYQVSVHLAKRLQRRIFLEIDQPETRIAYSGHVC
jgi:hypothetical protein